MDKKAIIDAIKSCVTKNGGYSVALPGYSVKEEDQEGGEGQGENYYIVYKVSDDHESILVKVNGFYSSEEGVDWSYGDAIEVLPFEKTVRAWKSAETGKEV